MEEINKINESNILPLFLIEPKYRIWRHLLFILVGAIITFNQVFIAYQDCSSILGNRILPICLSSFLLYCIAIYFNYYYLVPKFLFKEKYTIYLIILAVIVFLLPALSIAEEYQIRNSLDLPHRITSYTNPLILVDSLALFMITAICFLCVTIVQLFHNWIKKNEHVSRLEYEHSKSEVNKLKGQITPGFLSKTLGNAAASVKTNPKKTTDMLVKLGQLLRYQLYDCNRDKVLLKSEVNFLTNFLTLEQLNKNNFRYNIHADNNVNNIFVSPLLFISLIQNMIETGTHLELLFYPKGKSLFFQCKSDNEYKLTDDELLLIKKRLDIQYPDKYSLSVDPGFVKLQIDISE